MPNKLQLSGHKMLYHLEHLNKWVKGEDFYPIYVELGPTTVCNQRCIHCYIRYLGFKNVFLDRKIMLKLVRDLGRIGVKALCFAGTGEPFMHKATPEVILEAKKSGLDVACATNGVLFTRDIAEKVLGSLTWIRFSILGGSKETYMKLQGAKEQDWDRLLTNLKHTVGIKRKEKLDTAIGIVFFIFKENGHEVLGLAKQMKEIGVDYFVVKPVGDYEKNKYVAQKDLKEEFEKELKAVDGLSSQYFKAQVRWDMFEKWETKPYKKCLSLGFMTVIEADGGVYACGGYWQDKRYCYGNLYEKSFPRIWDSPERKELMKYIQERTNFKECYNCCRNHTINKFLWQLHEVPMHVNFI